MLKRDKRKKGKKDELKDKRKVYNQKYYQKRKNESVYLYDQIPIYIGYNMQQCVVNPGYI